MQRRASSVVMRVARSLPEGLLTRNADRSTTVKALSESSTRLVRSIVRRRYCTRSSSERDQFGKGCDDAHEVALRWSGRPPRAGQGRHR
jgi:hypothetical protein